MIARVALILVVALGIGYVVLLHQSTTMTLVCKAINYWENFTNTNSTSISTATIYTTIGSFQIENITTYSGSTFTESGSTPGQYWNNTVCTLTK